MRRRLLPLLLLLVLALAPATARAAVPRDEAPPPPAPPGGQPAPTPTPAPPAPATVPSGKPLIYEGADGRVLMDGPWLFRLDDANAGVAQRFFAQTATDGWSGTTVPNVWNGADGPAANSEGSVAWYRKDFKLPSRAKGLSWVVRFEAVNFRATVWLNGRRLAYHVGGYTPFEVALANVRRTGVNRLVVRVDNRRFAGQPSPPRGWWDYGGIQREVELRRVDRVDVGEVQVASALRGRAATVTTSAVVRNVSHATQKVHLTGRFGAAPYDLGTRTIAAGQQATFTRSIAVKRPKLWSPAHPSLYTVRLAATAAQDKHKPTVAAGYRLRTGIRTLRVTRTGQLVLNGNVVVHFRGVAIHEDALGLGSALDSSTRSKLIGLVKDVGATLVRAHYPLHPAFEELADRNGILLWNEIPSTYQLADSDLGRAPFQRLAMQELHDDVVTNRNHPSVLVWSLGNEMASDAGPNQTAYLQAGATLVRGLDATRPIGLAFAGHPETPCQIAYAPIDLLGMNDYFGWYTGFGGNIADRDELPAFLAQLRSCYPRKAIAVTEFGAEANRDGPAEEKGTYAFQNEFIQDHLDVYAATPWLTGAVYWSLQEFRISPGWGGGNPWSSPPLHQKGVVRLDFTKKPGYAVLQAGYRKARQYVPLGRGRG